MKTKDTGGKETGAKETGGKEMEGKATGAKAPGAKVPGGKETGAQYRQETGGKGGMLMDEREMDNMLPGDTTAGQNAAEVIRCKSYSELVIER